MNIGNFIGIDLFFFLNVTHLFSKCVTTVNAALNYTLEALFFVTYYHVLI